MRLVRGRERHRARCGEEASPSSSRPKHRRLRYCLPCGQRRGRQPRHQRPHRPGNCCAAYLAVAPFPSRSFQNVSCTKFHTVKGYPYLQGQQGCRTCRSMPSDPKEDRLPVDTHGVRDGCVGGTRALLRQRDYPPPHHLRCLARPAAASRPVRPHEGRFGWTLRHLRYFVKQ